MTDKPRVLIVQPSMQPPGGGQSVAAWATMALQEEYALDVFTWVPLDVNEVNRFYGTALDLTKIRHFQVPAWVRTLYSKDPDPWSFQPIALMSRVVKIIRGRYDVVLSFCDEVDLGAPSIQYIHFPYLQRIFARERALRGQGRLRVLPEHLRPWRLISGFSFERVKQNVSLANSNWTGTMFAGIYDAPWQLLYPPVNLESLNVPWTERANNFVCIGRFSGEKRYEDIVEILAAVRARGHKVELHIVGASMGRAMDLSYYKFLVNLVETHREWVTLHENISRADLRDLLARQKYGIHAMRDEHFGVAPAEMVRAGCIVFVCNDGGQVEIVGNEERLRYNSVPDAVEKIVGVLQDAKAQTELRTALAARAALYSPERFMMGLCKVVDETRARRA